MEGRQGDVDFLLGQLRTAVASRGRSGHFSTWPIPINMLFVETGVLYAIEFLEGRVGRHDRAAYTRIMNSVAGNYGTSVELSNWPMGDGRVLENYYMVLSGFVTF